MTELLRVIPLESKEPVAFVCYHPIAEKHLLRGEIGEMSEPTCLAVEYEYDSILHELCCALGWQGGTISQVVDEVKRLKQLCS